MDRSPIIPGAFMATHVKPTVLIRRGGLYRILCQGREIDLRVTAVIAQPVGDLRKEVVLIPIIIRGTTTGYRYTDTSPAEPMECDTGINFSLIQCWQCLEEPPETEEVES